MAVAVRPKVLDFEAAIDREGRVSAEGCPPLELADVWTAEHLLLAALVRCSLTSFRYHATRVGAEAAGGGTVSGRVTKRHEDGRYAFVEIALALEVELAPAPPDAELAEL